jgi:RNA polymerase sigma-70 factor (ECF subfamily)
MDDVALIRQTLAGHRDAFRLLVLRHQRGLFRFLSLLGCPPAVVEELSQETFLRAYRHLADFDERRGRFTTWLFTLARNLAANEAAKPRHRLEAACDTLAANPDGAPDPLARAESNERYTRLLAALSALPEGLRSALLLSQVEGLAIDDVASVQGCAVGTVKSRIFRAREQLRAALREEPI